MTARAKFLRWDLTETAKDIQRLRQEYQARANRYREANPYSFMNPSHLFIIQQRERKILDLLRGFGENELSKMQILAIGCGNGAVLLDLVRYGADSYHVWGIDLIYNRLKNAKEVLPSGKFLSGDGQSLPFQSQSFDLLLQFTAFSSILDSKIKQNMAAEMLRVLKPGGAILWYDFWWNPTNPQTIGIKPKEIKTLFPNCEYVFEKITLAPPLARRIVTISWQLAVFLESLKLFNSHYLVLIKKRDRIL